MKKKIIMFSILLCLAYIAYSGIWRNSRIHRTPYQKKDLIDSAIEGTWCASNDISMNTTVVIHLKNDSIFCRYYIIYNHGNRLNAANDDSDWAFKVPIKVFDTSKYISTFNYNDLSNFHLSLKYNKNDKTLIWETLETNFYPQKLRLYRCEL